MTDRPDSSADESPEIAEVRRLLAGARHTETMPGDVSRRLDDVLTGLADERASEAQEDTPAPPVVSIAAHRRRRAAGLLVAAAAIVVGGVVLAPNLPSPGRGGETGASSAEDQAERNPKANLGDTGGAPTSPSAPAAQDSVGKAELHHGRVVVHPRHFSDDALEGRALLATPARSQALAPTAGCADLARHDRAVPAEYLDAPAALVYRRAQGSSQVVDLFVCGTSTPVRSTTLPAP